MNMLSNEKVKESALVLRAINHRIRRDIMNLLHDADDGGICVTNIYESLGLDQPVVSKHLGILSSVGVVVGEKIGRHIYYTIHQENLNKIKSLLDELSSMTNPV